MKRLLSVLLFAFPLTLRAQDSTATAIPQNHTLMERLGLGGAHLGLGGGSGPNMGNQSGKESSSEFRLGFTPRRAPDWALAFTLSALMNADTTGYVVPGSNGYHPRMAATTTGLEVQRRWRRGQMLHPMAVLGAGQLKNSYNYFKYPKSGGSEFHQEESTGTAYATLAGGGELNVAGWFRVALTVGYRRAGGARIPFGVGNNSGVTSAMLFEMGKF